MKKFSLEITVFISGAVVMVLEIVGSRVLGPYLGTSVVVWTSLIGIILGSLSIGYWLGGRLSDRSQSREHLSLILLLAACLIGITTLLKEGFLGYLDHLMNDVGWKAVVGTIVLFAPASILLGMVTPYATRLRLENLHTAGGTVGGLYALSTIGSIVGTFAAGFWLIPLLGTTSLLFALSIAILIASLICSSHLLIYKTVLMLLIGYFALNPPSAPFIDVDTKYNRVWIYETKNDKGQTIKQMSISGRNSAAKYLKGDSLVLPYAKFFDLAAHFSPSFQNTLLIGGAAYAYPQYFLKAFPNAEMDVVELDPGLTRLAKKHFGLKSSPRLHIHHQDGRIFLNNTRKKWDVILMDAYHDENSQPFQLTTLQAVKQINRVMKDDGVVLANILSSIVGKKGMFLRAEVATYKEVFSHVELFPVEYPTNGSKFQNVILVAYQGDKRPLAGKNPRLNGLLQHHWNDSVKLNMPVLTDNYAPVNYYSSFTYR